MIEPLYELDGPSCALDMGENWLETFCPVCGIGRVSQDGDLSVDLICQPRQVWYGGGGFLLTTALAHKLQALRPAGMYLQHVNARWLDDIPPRPGLPPPALLQVRTTLRIHLAQRSLKDVCPACGTGGFAQPLLVQRTEVSSEYAIWKLVDSDRMLLFTSAVRDFLAAADPDLRFAELPYEESAGEQHVRRAS